MTLGNEALNKPIFIAIQPIFHSYRLLFVASSSDEISLRATTWAYRHLRTYGIIKRIDSALSAPDGGFWHWAIVIQRKVFIWNTILQWRMAIQAKYGFINFLPMNFVSVPLRKNCFACFHRQVWIACLYAEQTPTIVKNLLMDDSKNRSLILKK